MKRRRRPVTPSVTVILALTTALSTTSQAAATTTTATTDSSADEAFVRVAETKPPSDAVSVSFYADTSCLLRVDQRSSIGRTLIDADFGESASRTLIHCDTRDGRRLTLLARSDEVGTRGRFELLTRDAIDNGDVGFIAWLTRAGTSFVDETAPRRYVATGRVIMRELPIAQVDGAARHSSRRAFARIEGELEPLLAHPEGQEVPSD